jgi:hypothetical protein
MSEVTELHEPFIGFLRSQGLLYRRSRPDRKTSETKGEPDFLVMENGRVLAIEFKDKNSGKLSKDQVFRHAEYARAGCRVFVVRELTAAIELVNAWRSDQGQHFYGAESLPKRKFILGQWWRETGSGNFVKELEKVRSA